MAIPWYIVKYYFQKHTKFFTSTVCLLLLTVICYRYIFLTLIAWSFMVGVAVAYSFLSTDFLVPNLLFMFSRGNKRGVDGDDELTLMKAVCTVCGQRKCPRHRPELNILAFQPWTNLEIRKSVDQALEELLNIVMNEFVYTWYKNLSTDEEFVDELRSTIRFFLSVILRRAKKIDLPNLAVEKLLKAGLQHLHAFRKARETCPAGSDIQKATLSYLGPHLHYAMDSRKSELEYLRRMVEKLFPYILRPQALESKAMCALVREILAGSVLMPAMDAVANPDMVNNMILIFLDDTPPPPPPSEPSPNVSFLAGFSNHQSGSLGDPELPPKVSRSSLRLVLGDVMDPEKPKMLYPFMQFLKTEAAVNVLQFALSCEDFNKRILNPDLSESEVASLHVDLKEMYRNYLGPSAPDRIHFEEEMVQELQEIVDGPVESVLKLRTTTPMFRAYEHVYNLLSYTFLPLFHQSEDYYTMICGERLASQTSSRNSSSAVYMQAAPNYYTRQPKKKEFGISTLGSKLKGVFRSSDSRTSLDQIDTIENTEEADTITIASTDSLESEVGLDYLETTITQLQPHNLSSWRVTIPRIGARPDPDNPKKQFFVFIIDVRRVDVTNDGKSMWTVPRRYHEFYVLEQKLKEFHGDQDDCALPAKKIMGTKNQDFVEGMREHFENYLQKLLTKPYLKGSQLLYNFLTQEEQFDSGFDINIGRVLKSVPRKLMKEKGQHLETFLQSFEKSTEAPKPRPSKRERRDSGASYQSTSSEKLCTTIYENNADGRDPALRSSQLEDHSEINGLFDTLIYIARYVFHAPDWCHHVLYTCRILFKTTLESYLDWYLDTKVKQVTQEHRLVDFVHLLRDVLFFDTDPPRTDDQKKQRLEEAIQGCLDFLPRPLVWALGEQSHQEGTLTILTALQQPKLNKQLSYVFLDIMVTELFPELLMS